MFISATLGFGIASLILHRSLRWLAGRFTLDWRIAQSAAILALLLALFAASMAGTGILRQFGLMAGNPLFKNPYSFGNQVRDENLARQLALAARLYASDHDGRYPENLEDVVEAQYIDRWSNLAIARIGSEPFLYYGAGLRESSPDHSVVIASARSSYRGSTRIVISKNGESGFAPEELFQAMIASQMKGDH